jgi:hypothetical protein
VENVKVVRPVTPAAKIATSKEASYLPLYVLLTIKVHTTLQRITFGQSQNGDSLKEAAAFTKDHRPDDFSF